MAWPGFLQTWKVHSKSWQTPPRFCQRCKRWGLFFFFFNRFSNSNKSNIDPYGFLTFGPRACISVRLSTLVVKLALMEILQHFSFVPCKETDVRRIFFSSAILEKRDCVGAWLPGQAVSWPSVVTAVLLLDSTGVGKKWICCSQEAHRVEAGAHGASCLIPGSQTARQMKERWVSRLVLTHDGFPPTTLNYYYYFTTLAINRILPCFVHWWHKSVSHCWTIFFSVLDFSGYFPVIHCGIMTFVVWAFSLVSGWWRNFE